MKHRLIELMAKRQEKTGERVTVIDVARGAGVSPQTMYKWVNEGITRFDSETVAKLCNYFGCELHELLYLEEEKKPA